MILKSKEETTRSDKDTIIKYTSDNFLCIFTDHSHIGKQVYFKAKPGVP